MRSSPKFRVLHLLLFVTALVTALSNGCSSTSSSPNAAPGASPSGGDGAGGTSGVPVLPSAATELSFGSLCASGARCHLSGGFESETYQMGCNDGALMKVESANFPELHDGFGTSCLKYVAGECAGKSLCSISLSSSHCESLSVAPANSAGGATFSCSVSRVANPSASGSSVVKVQSSGLCIDASLNNTNASIIQSACSQNATQNLAFRIADDNSYTIQAAGNSALCFDNQGAGYQLILQKPCDGSINQKWQVIPVGGANYMLYSKGNALCANVMGNSLVAGGQIYTYDCNGNNNEVFTLAQFTPISFWPEPSLTNGVAPEMSSQDNHENDVVSFERWLGHRAEFAVDFIADDSWGSFVSDAAYASGAWHARNPARRVMWSIPLTVKGTSLAEVAAGAADASIVAVAKNLAANQPNAIIRLGWEFNGDWFSWSAIGHPQDYINAYRHVRTIFKDASVQFTFVWSFNSAMQNFHPETAYPGDDAVDVVGISIYDFNWNNQSYADRWQSNLNGAYTLQWMSFFSHLHKKPMALTEWGAGQLGDNPLYIQNMFNWIRANHFLYQAWWEGTPGSNYNSDLQDHAFPLEEQIFKRNF